MFKKNTRYPNFKQKYFTAGDYEQFNQMVVLSNYNECISNTLKYIFHKFKKGIFVHIKDNKIYKFVPFCKSNFINEFAHKLQYDPNEWKSWSDMFEHIKKYTNEKIVIEINTKYGWWANNGLIRYEKPKYEYDVGIEYIYNLITKCLEMNKIRDCTFFINKRDFPILKLDLTESYSSIWNIDTPLVSHCYNTYAPILSMTSSKGFADIPIPTWDDYIKDNDKINVNSNWDNKIDKAVFRGSSTGLGTTMKNNSRIRLLKIGKEDKFNLLDVGITKWNLRPRKTINDKYYRTISKKILDKYTTSNFLSYSEQSNYKYIINLPGHVSSFRLSTLLKLKSVILHVPNTDNYIWYEYLLKPYIHYIPIDKNLNNLLSQIRWCQKNTKACKAIIENCSIFYNKYLTLFGQITFTTKILDTLDNYELSQVLCDKPLPEYNFDISNMQPLTSLSNICKHKTFYLVDDKYLLKEYSKIEIENYIKYIKPLEHSYTTNFNEYMGWRKIYGKRLNYTILDFIQPKYYISLYDYLYQSTNVDIGIIQDCVLQICILLNNAYNVSKFIHNDCVPWNILISINYQQPKNVYIQSENDEYIFNNTCCTLYLIDYEKGKVDERKEECRDIFNLIIHILFLIFTNMYHYSQHTINMCANLFNDIFPNNDCQNITDILDILSLFKKYDNMTSANLKSINSKIDLTNYIEFFNLLQHHFTFTNITKRQVFDNANILYKQYLNLKNFD